MLNPTIWRVDAPRRNPRNGVVVHRNAQTLQPVRKPMARIHTTITDCASNACKVKTPCKAVVTGLPNTSGRWKGPSTQTTGRELTRAVGLPWVPAPSATLVCRAARDGERLTGRNQTARDPAKCVNVHVSVRHQVEFGQSVKLVGNVRELGQWNPAKGVDLRWGPGHVWSCEVALPAGQVEFKAVVVTPGDGTPPEWQPCHNRVLQVPATPGRLSVICTWRARHTRTSFHPYPTAGPRPGFMTSPFSTSAAADPASAPQPCSHLVTVQAAGDSQLQGQPPTTRSATAAAGARGVAGGAGLGPGLESLSMHAGVNGNGVARDGPAAHNGTSKAAAASNGAAARNGVDPHDSALLPSQRPSVPAEQIPSSAAAGQVGPPRASGGAGQGAAEQATHSFPFHSSPPPSPSPPPPAARTAPAPTRSAHHNTQHPAATLPPPSGAAARNQHLPPPPPPQSSHHQQQPPQNPDTGARPPNQPPTPLRHPAYFRIPAPTTSSSSSSSFGTYLPGALQVPGVSKVHGEAGVQLVRALDEGFAALNAAIAGPDLSALTAAAVEEAQARVAAWAATAAAARNGDSAAVGDTAAGASGASEPITVAVGPLPAGLMPPPTASAVLQSVGPGGGSADVADGKGLAVGALCSEAHARLDTGEQPDAAGCGEAAVQDAAVAIPARGGATGGSVDAAGAGPRDAADLRPSAEHRAGVPVASGASGAGTAASGHAAPPAAGLPPQLSQHDLPADAVAPGTAAAGVAPQQRVPPAASTQPHDHQDVQSVAAHSQPQPDPPSPHQPDHHPDDHRPEPNPTLEPDDHPDHPAAVHEQQHQPPTQHHPQQPYAAPTKEELAAFHSEAEARLALLEAGIKSKRKALRMRKAMAEAGARVRAELEAKKKGAEEKQVKLVKVQGETGRGSDGAAGNLVHRVLRAAAAKAVDLAAAEAEQEQQRATEAARVRADAAAGIVRALADAHARREATAVARAAASATAATAPAPAATAGLSDSSSSSIPVSSPPAPAPPPPSPSASLLQDSPPALPDATATPHGATATSSGTTATTTEAPAAPQAAAATPTPPPPAPPTPAADGPVQAQDQPQAGITIRSTASDEGPGPTSSPTAVPALVAPVTSLAPASGSLGAGTGMMYLLPPPNTTPAAPAAGAAAAEAASPLPGSAEAVAPAAEEATAPPEPAAAVAAVATVPAVAAVAEGVVAEEQGVQGAEVAAAGAGAGVQAMVAANMRAQAEAVHREPAGASVTDAAAVTAAAPVGTAVPDAASSSLVEGASRDGPATAASPSPAEPANDRSAAGSGVARGTAELGLGEKQQLQQQQGVAGVGSGSMGPDVDGSTEDSATSSMEGSTGGGAGGSTEDSTRVAGGLLAVAEAVTVDLDQTDGFMTAAGESAAASGTSAAQQGMEGAPGASLDAGAATNPVAAAAAAGDSPAALKGAATEGLCGTLQEAAASETEAGAAGATATAASDDDGCSGGVVVGASDPAAVRADAGQQLPAAAGETGEQARVPDEMVISGLEAVCVGASPSDDSEPVSGSPGPSAATVTTHHVPEGDVREAGQQVLQVLPVLGEQGEGVGVGPEAVAGEEVAGPQPETPGHTTAAAAEAHAADAAGRTAAADECPAAEARTAATADAATADATAATADARAQRAAAGLAGSATIELRAALHHALAFARALPGGLLPDADGDHGSDGGGARGVAAGGSETLRPDQPAPVAEASASAGANSSGRPPSKGQEGEPRASADAGANPPAPEASSPTPVPAVAVAVAVAAASKDPLASPGRVPPPIPPSPWDASATSTPRAAPPPAARPGTRAPAPTPVRAHSPLPATTTAHPPSPATAPATRKAQVAGGQQAGRLKSVERKLRDAWSLAKLAAMACASVQLTDEEEALEAAAAAAATLRLALARLTQAEGQYEVHLAVQQGQYDKAQVAPREE